MSIYFIIITAIITRFLPHEANVGVITALAIFAGAYLPWKQAVILPVAIRFISDLFLGFFSWPLMIAVYAAHLSGMVFGQWISSSRSKLPKWLKIVTAACSSSAVFFFLTNFALLYPEYPHTADGIVLAYVNGLPFLRGTLVGDIGYSLVLFGVYELVMYAKKKQVVLPSIIHGYSYGKRA